MIPENASISTMPNVKKLKGGVNIYALVYAPVWTVVEVIIQSVVTQIQVRSFIRVKEIT